MTLLADRTTGLDLQSVAPAERVPAFLSAFDDLAPEEALVVIGDGDEEQLLVALQAERPGLFEWSPLEEGPRTWRVEVVRRRQGSPRRRELTEALAFDHDRLEDMQAAAFDARSTGDLDGAGRIFAEFAHGLRRHMAYEERLLFPVYERKAGLSSAWGPTALMRTEHREIEALLDTIGREIALLGSPVSELRLTLYRLLTAHNLKEEQILYPGTDRLLSEAERDEIVRRVQAFRT